MLTINAEKREIGVKAQDLKSVGKIPAVFYGAGKLSTSITINLIEFKKIWKDAGESSTIKIKTDKDIVDVLIHEVQVDPITDIPIHVDFLVIDMKKKIIVSVPLEFTGMAGAVKSGLGNLVKVLYEVEVEALPSELPHSLTVDVTPLLNVKDQIITSQIKLPAGVSLITSPEEVVVLIAEQKEEKEEETTSVDLSAIEVEKKGKQEEAEGVEASEEEKN